MDHVISPKQWKDSTISTCSTTAQSAGSTKHPGYNNGGKKIELPVSGAKTMLSSSHPFGSWLMSTKQLIWTLHKASGWILPVHTSTTPSWGPPAFRCSSHPSHPPENHPLWLLRSTALAKWRLGSAHRWHSSSPQHLHLRYKPWFAPDNKQTQKKMGFTLVGLDVLRGWQ